MSRSYRKTPIVGASCSRSNKRFKQYEHRAERKKIKQLLALGIENLPHPKEYGNEWDSPRDGKNWFGDLDHELEFRKWMAK